MSKLKSPREKKEASLHHDCRNAYGENDKASRKNIPRRKQMSHQAERRVANSALETLRNVNEAQEEIVFVTEQKVLDQSLERRRKGFKKRPDAPLKSLLQYQRTGRWPNVRDK